MSDADFSQLIDEIQKRQSLVRSYLFSDKNRIAFGYKHLDDAVYSYLKAGGKALRPAVLMLCCGAVGGDEKTAIPAAATVELYHTFTLVHDDIIDRDEKRRGVPTVHFEFGERAREELGFGASDAEHYGMTIAILTGDILQGWAASLLPDLYHEHNLPPELALNLIRELFRKTQIKLINGETVDVLQARTPVDQLTESQVLTMLEEKTGVLYEFAGRAGAAIGLAQSDLRHPLIQSVAAFARKSGIAFQLQDDILGIVGDEKELGKPVGSDIREGKRTLIVLNSLPRMTTEQKRFTLDILGDRNASPSDVHNVIGILKSSGGIDYVKGLAQRYIADALTHLTDLPHSRQKVLLESWAAYIIERIR
jgi:geranylgeranyl diphosphate synthase type I